LHQGRIATVALIAAVAGIALAVRGGPARADEPRSRVPVILTGLRTWTAPSGTRLVLDFSRPVDAVMPDSGAAARVVISVPVAGLSRPDSVPTVLAVRDTAIDSVFVAIDERGARITLTLAPGATFKAFTLPAADDKPFRIVVDVRRAGAQAAEDRKLSEIATQKRRDRVRLVYVDAGHGGEDTGARGPGGVLEKNVTLAIARDLVEELNKVKGLRAILTRDADFFIPLQQRFKLAERAHADLFVSIHCNSSRRRGRGSGTEVYFLSLQGASDQADKDLADSENAADLVGGVPAQAEDDVIGVLYNVKRNAALERSQLLAETLLDHVAADRRVESRGIKQAGFAVLKSVEFPSVLVETAFINNPREAQLLRNPTFQRSMSKQLAAGMVAYFAAAGVRLGQADSSRTAAPSGEGTR
jgi:N-acetylmuramoyl-L-alanine amidase